MKCGDDILTHSRKLLCAWYDARRTGWKVYTQGDSQAKQSWDRTVSQITVRSHNYSFRAYLLSRRIRNQEGLDRAGKILECKQEFASQIPESTKEGRLFASGGSHRLEGWRWEQNNWTLWMDGSLHHVWYRADRDPLNDHLAE